MERDNRHAGESRRGLSFGLSADELVTFPTRSSSTYSIQDGAHASAPSYPPIFGLSGARTEEGWWTRMVERWSGRRQGWLPLGDTVQCRLITRENPYRFNVRRRGSPLSPLFGDLYHSLLDTTWWKLLIGLCLFFFFEHIFFAALYYQDRKGLQGLNGTEESRLIDFWTCFFFSVQTMQTIGYGGLSPQSVYANVLVCIQAFWGMLSTAIITGFVFAKIGRPSRQKRNIMFSELAVVNSKERYWYGNPDRLSEGSYVHGGAPCLVFRFTNIRKSQVCEPRFRLLLLRREMPQDEEDADYSIQEECFRIHELNYELNSMEYRARGVDFSSALLPLPWTVVHVLDERSPLYGATPDSLAASDAEIIAILEGTDEGCSEQIQARWSYTCREIIWEARFVPVVSRDRLTGKYVIDLSRFHDIVPVIAQPPRIKGKARTEQKQVDEDRLI